MEETGILIDKMLKELREGTTPNDKFYIYLNPLGAVKFKNVLNLPDKPYYELPKLSVPISIDYVKQLINIYTLFQYAKGVEILCVTPQRLRSFISYINQKILEYINKPEMDIIIQIIHELTANGEKANMEDTVYKIYGAGKEDSHKIILAHQDEIIKDMIKLKKFVSINWKFSPEVYKVEVRNNTPISEELAMKIKEKTFADISNLAEVMENELETENKIGAGLGLFMVKFFRDTMKQKGFETIFRIYENNGITISSLTVIFEKTR